MNRFILLTGAFLLSFESFAGKRKPSHKAEALFSVGAVHLPLHLDGLNGALQAGGYPTLNRNLTALGLSMGIEPDRAPRLSLGFNYHYAAGSQGASEPFAIAYSFHYARAGFGWELLGRKRLDLQLQPALYLNRLHLHCYSYQTDTASLGNYLQAQPADEKSAVLSQSGFDLRATANWRLPEHILVQAFAGCQLPFGPVYGLHFRGDFNDLPGMRLSGFYAGLQVGAHSGQ